MKTSMMKQWINSDQEPKNIYELLGCQLLDANSDTLLAAIESANQDLLNYQNLADAAKQAKTLKLFEILGKFQAILESPDSLQKHNEQIIEDLRQRYSQALGKDPGLCEQQRLQTWLLRQQVHPDSVPAVLVQFASRPAKTRPSTRVFGKPSPSSFEAQTVGDAKNEPAESFEILGLSPEKPAREEPAPTPPPNEQKQPTRRGKKRAEEVATGSPPGKRSWLIGGGVAGVLVLLLLLLGLAFLGRPDTQRETLAQADKNKEIQQNPPKEEEKPQLDAKVDILPKKEDIAPKKEDIAPKKEDIAPKKEDIPKKEDFPKKEDKTPKEEKIPDPDPKKPMLNGSLDRFQSLQKLARNSLDSLKAGTQDGPGVIQDTLRLAQASTMACALFHKEVAKYDDLASQSLTIERKKEGAMEGDNPKKKKKLGSSETSGSALSPGVINDRLTLADQVFGPRYRKSYIFEMKADTSYTIDLMSSSFDAYLYLEDPMGQTVAFNDDGGKGRNSRIFFRPVAAGNYKVIATSLGGRSLGFFTLRVAEGLVPLAFPGNPPPDIKPAKLQEGAEADLKALESSNPQKRVAAFQHLAAGFQDDLEFRTAEKMARYLLTRKKKDEIDQIADSLRPLAKSSNLLMATADTLTTLTQFGSNQSLEAVIEALTGQPFKIAPDDTKWTWRCRLKLLQQGVGKEAAPPSLQTEGDLLREFYRLQGVQFGLDSPDFLALPRPSEVLAQLIRQVAGKLKKGSLSPEDQKELGQVDRHIRVAQFLAQNDLEHTVLLQRILIKILTVQVAGQNSARTKEAQQLWQDLQDYDGKVRDLLLLLRQGEGTALRLWLLTLDLS